jgi:hypothetical protein
MQCHSHIAARLNDTVAHTTVFAQHPVGETVRFDRSGTSPTINTQTKIFEFTKICLRTVTLRNDAVYGRAFPL